MLSRLQIRCQEQRLGILPYRLVQSEVLVKNSQDIERLKSGVVEVRGGRRGKFACIPVTAIAPLGLPGRSSKAVLNLPKIDCQHDGHDDPY